MPSRARLGCPVRCRVSQVPRPICRRALSPRTPASPAAASTHVFAADAGFTISGRLAARTWFHEAVPGSLALRLASPPHEASARPIARPPARSAPSLMGSYDDEHLAVHKIGQAWPGAPEERRIWSRSDTAEQLERPRHQPRSFACGLRMTQEAPNLAQERRSSAIPELTHYFGQS